MTNSNWPEIKEGVINTLVVLAIFAGIAWIGSTSPLWLLLYCPVTLGAFAYWAGKGNLPWTYRLAGIGLLAAALWNIFGI